MKYDMIQEGDNIAVCISGRKGFHAAGQMHAGDSAPRENGIWSSLSGNGSGLQPGKQEMIEENARIMGIPITVFESDIFNVVGRCGPVALLSVRPHEKRLISMQTLRSWGATRLPWDTILTT